MALCVSGLGSNRQSDGSGSFPVNLGQGWITLVVPNPRFWLSQSRGMCRRRLKHWWNEELSNLIFFFFFRPTTLFSSLANFMSHCLPTSLAELKAPPWSQGLLRQGSIPLVNTLYQIFLFPTLSSEHLKVKNPVFFVSSQCASTSLAMGRHSADYVDVN